MAEPHPRPIIDEGATGRTSVMSTFENMKKWKDAPTAQQVVALRLTGGVALTALLAGCAVGPDFARPTPPTIENYSPHASNDVVTAAPSAVDDAQRVVPGLQIEVEWWREFRSPRLDAFIADALAQSPTLVAAEATLRQAQEYQRARSGSTQLPQAELGATAQRQRFNPGALGQGRTLVNSTFTIPVSQSAIISTQRVAIVAPSRHSGHAQTLRNSSCRQPN